MTDQTVSKSPAKSADGKVETKAGKAVPATKPKPVVPAPADTAASVAAIAAAAVSAPAAPVETPSAAPSAAVIEEEKTMSDTFQNAAADTTDKAKALFGEAKDRASDAMAKGQQAMGDLNEMAKGNMEALVESSKIAAKGAQDIARYSADYGRKTIEQANENAKRLAAVKSPTELFQLQSEFAKSAVEEIVAETSKFTENYLKLLGDIAQPLSNRVAVSVEKVKQAA